MTPEEPSRTSKTVKKGVLKGDRSLDALLSRLGEKFKVFWTPKELGYLMEPIGVKDDFKKGVRNIQQGGESH